MICTYFFPFHRFPFQSLNSFFSYAEGFKFDTVLLFNYDFVAYAFWYHIHEITAKNLKKTQKKFFVDTKTRALMIGSKMHFGSLGRTGRPGVLPPTGLQRVGQDYVTEQQQDPPRLRPQALFHFSLAVVCTSSEFSKPLPATLLWVCHMYVTQE